MSDWKSMAGKASDREVSRIFGIGSNTVRRYRLQHDIPVHEPQNAIPDAILGQLAEATNYKLAEDLKIPIKHIAALRIKAGIPEPKIVRARFKPLEDGIWTAEALALLGTMPDPALADQLGVSRFPVKMKRRELGIAPYQKQYPVITAELAAEFGQTSDSSLAKRLGVSASYIRRARLKSESL